MMHQLREERSIGELFGQLTQDLSLLVRQETQLAKSEIQVKVARAARDLKNLDPTPRRTVESIKEDIQIAKERRS